MTTSIAAIANNVVSALSTFGPLVGDLSAGNYALIMTGQRVIGDLYPHITIEENHHDELAITQHPVEFGTPVTDHAFMQPYTIEIRCGWSDSTAQTSGYVQAVYRALLALQVSRVPFSVSTGKRSYQSMLLRTLIVKTDPESEYTLMVVATAQRIVITNTQITSQASPANTNGNNSIGHLNPGSLTGSPTAMIDNGIGTIPATSATSDPFGTITWSNGVALSGQQQLNLAAPGSPLPPS